jgi:hypothetical protein
MLDISTLPLHPADFTEATMNSVRGRQFVSLQAFGHPP